MIKVLLLLTVIFERKGHTISLVPIGSCNKLFGPPELSGPTRRKAEIE